MRIICLILFQLLILSSFGMDLSNYGDFSSRSMILKGFSQNEILPELKEILRYKKLEVSPECLIKQVNSGNLDNVAILLRTGLNPNLSYNGEYAIHVAAKNNNFDILKLLYESGARLDKGFYSELYEAVKNKNTQMAQYLIDRGANINYRDGITTNSIVYVACKNNMIDIAKQLAQKGAQADSKTLRYIQKHKIKLIEQ